MTIDRSAAKRVRALCVACVTVALLLPAVAVAALDLSTGERAVRDAYQSTEGDEGGFGGSLVEQCRAEGETTVRCVVVAASGISSLDSDDSREERKPVDFGVARQAPTGQVTTSREPFTEPVTSLDADIRVRERLRRTPLGRVAIRVSPDVPAKVTVSGRFGKTEIKSGRVRERTVEVKATGTDIALDLTDRQRRRISDALKRDGSLRAVITVRVVGDVGPADATEIETADVRIVR